MRLGLGLRSRVLELVPEGYGVVVDPGGPFTAVLAATAIRRGALHAHGGSAS